MTDQERRAIENCVLMAHNPVYDEDVNRILRRRSQEAHIRGVMDGLKIVAIILLFLAAFLF